MRPLLELYCVIVIKLVAFFAICAKLTMAFTFTTLPLKFYTSVFTLLFLFDVVVVLDLNKNFGGTTDLAKKKAQVGGFAYPYSPPSQMNLVNCSPCVVNRKSAI